MCPDGCEARQNLDPCPVLTYRGVDRDFLAARAPTPATLIEIPARGGKDALSVLTLITLRLQCMMSL
jgi:hypothetical protein